VHLAYNDVAPTARAGAAINHRREWRLSCVGIVPGSCMIFPVAPGLVVADSASRFSTRTIVIAEGETVDNVDFELLPGGIVTGA